MANRTYSEILEIATTLERDFMPLREDAQRRYDLYTLRKSPLLAEDQAREGQVDILSPLVIYAAHTVRSDLMMNPTEFTVIPLARDSGAVPVNDQKKSDSLERALATIWGRLNEGRRIDRDIIWHQLVSPFGVMILECLDIDYPNQEEDEDDTEYSKKIDKYQREHMKWRVTIPDPLTCAFLERDGKPTIFVRRYKQLVRDIEQTYSKRRGSPNPTMDIRYLKDHWEWCEASDDYDPEKWRNSSTGLKEVEMIWLDDGEMIYQVALSGAMDSNKGGEMVWCGPNPIGRVSAFIVPSSLTPMRSPDDRYEPYLWPLMQTVDQLNKIRTIRATASRNAAGPSTYIPLDPQVVLQYAKDNKPLPKSLKFKANETPYTLGEVKEKPMMIDPDMDKLETRLSEDLQRFLPSPFASVLDPAVLKAATATSILHAAESGMRLYGPLMSAYDGAIRDLFEGIVASISRYYKDEPVYTYAMGDEMVRGVNLKQGEAFSLSNKSIDFPFRLTVKTRSMTQAQASAQYDLVLKQWILPDGSKGPATFDDLLDAANYPDKEAQKEKLAAERILNSADPVIQQIALAYAFARIQQNTSVDVATMYGAMVGGADGAMGSGGPPSFPGQEEGGASQAKPAMPNQAQRMDSPMLTGPQGGSSPT